MVITKIFFFSIAVLAVFAVVIIYFNYQLLVLLRKNYPIKWRDLGSPTLIINNSIKNNMAVLKFLKNKEYLEMNNQRLTKVSRLLWNMGLFYLFLLIMLMLLFLAKLRAPY